MHRRPNFRGHRWIAGTLSALFFWLVAAAGVPGGSSPLAAANAAPPLAHSAGMDGSQPSTRYLVNPNRHAIVSAAKAAEEPKLGHGGGPDPAMLPGETGLAETAAARVFPAVARHVPDGHAASGYNARAPPALI